MIGTKEDNMDNEELYEEQVRLQYELADLASRLKVWKKDAGVLLEQDKSQIDIEMDLVEVDKLLAYVKFRSY